MSSTNPLDKLRVPVTSQYAAYIKARLGSKDSTEGTTPSSSPSTPISSNSDSSSGSGPISDIMNMLSTLKWAYEKITEIKAHLDSWNNKKTSEKAASEPENQKLETKLRIMELLLKVNNELSKKDITEVERKLAEEFKKKLEEDLASIDGSQPLPLKSKL